MMLKFLFDADLQDFHLVKEVGMVPYYMHKEFGHDCEIISTRKKDEQFSNTKYVKGLKIKIINRPRFLIFLDYILKNSGKIDILMQIHTNPMQILLAFVYKGLNKNGISYVKGDIDEKILTINKIGIANLIRKFKTYLALSVSDILSVEKMDVFNFLCRQFPKFREKIIYYPSGFDSSGLEGKSFSFDSKANQIITVGRLGTKQKATETFLSALEMIKKELKGWKILLIGSIEPGFSKKIEEFYKKNPDLKETVLFTGEIKDRYKLYEAYKKSKIFCLTSRFESFALVLTEAAFFGNAIVSTKVGCAPEITDNGKYGKLCSIDNIKEIAEGLRYFINNRQKLKNCCDN